MSNSDPNQYKREVLHKTEAFEIVACEWSKTALSQFHSHGQSQCMILIQEGVFENHLDLGIRRELSILEPGQGVVTPVGARHEMRCMSEKGRTLHVYVPGLEAGAENPQFLPQTPELIKAALDLELRDESLRSKALSLLLQAVRQQSVATASPYFMNQLFSGTLPEILEAEKILAQTKTTMATFEVSPVFSMIELEVVNKLGELIGWPAGQREGLTVPGGSAANFMAFHCARHSYDPAMKNKGWRGGPALRIFASKESHYSLQKAAVVLGFGSENLVEVDVDASGRMDIEDLRVKLIACTSEGAVPLMVIATAGTTVLGAFDPLRSLRKLCDENNLWLHVDAAWGGPVLFSQQMRHLVDGIELADSVTFDAHKLFGANLTCAFFLSRHVGLLLDANDVSGGDYLFHPSDVGSDSGHLSWQCGRKPDAFAFWTLWKSHGTSGLGQFVDRLGQVRDATMAWVRQQSRIEIVSEPHFLNLCLRIHPQASVSANPQWSIHVRDVLKDQNFAMVNYSQNAEGAFLRLILANPFIEAAHVIDILERALAVR